MAAQSEASGKLLGKNTLIVHRNTMKNDMEEHDDTRPLQRV